MYIKLLDGTVLDFGYVSNTEEWEEITNIWWFLENNYKWGSCNVVNFDWHIV